MLEKRFEKYAVSAPHKVKKNGNHFFVKSVHSASIKLECSVKIKIEAPQKLEPKPINKSFVKYPINILQIAKKTKGRSILVEDSAIFFTTTLDKFALLIKTKYNNRNE